jgi:hypothetical protein
MNHGDILVKKERSGKVLSFEGRRADEYTEEYKPLRDGFKALDEIEHGKELTPDRISKIRQVRLILNDIKPSEDQNHEKQRFDIAIKKYESSMRHKNKRPQISSSNREGCPKGTTYNPHTGKCNKKKI